MQASTSVTWTANPALPAGAEIAVVAGQPTSPGIYAFRLRFPSAFAVLPHSHPDDRVYTVLAGTFGLGFGNEWDANQLQILQPGAVVVVPAGVAHFHESKSESTIVQVNGFGPTATNYVDPRHDPRRPPG